MYNVNVLNIMQPESSAQSPTAPEKGPLSISGLQCCGFNLLYQLLLHLCTHMIPTAIPYNTALHMPAVYEHHLLRDCAACAEQAILTLFCFCATAATAQNDTLVCYTKSLQNTNDSVASRAPRAVGLQQCISRAGTSTFVLCWPTMVRLCC